MGEQASCPIRVLCVFSTLDRGGAESMCMNLYRHIDRSKVQFDFVKHTPEKCAFDDDPANEIIDKLIESDGVIIGSPVYYAGPNGALCAILDRVFYAASANFKFKPGASIVSCRRGGASASFDRLNKYFTISNMPVVASQYWNSVHGNTPEEVKQDLEGLQTMRTLATNMAWILKSIENAELPKHEEEKQRTNFIM